MEASYWTFRPDAASLHIERLSDLQWDLEALRVIPENLRQNEAKLFLTKDWDYREMHPAKATALYAHCYGQTYMEAVARRAGDVHNARPFKGENWNPFEEAPVRARAFWKGRQLCDEAGMPYEFYMGMFFSIAEDYFEELPRPQELYRKFEAAKVLEVWDGMETIGLIRYPESECYKLRYNWGNKPCQVAFEKYLVERMMLKPVEVRRIAVETNRDYIRDETAKLLAE